MTSYAYDALNRLTRTTFDDGSFTETEYDAAGRVTAEIDALGNRTEHAYDAAGRRTSTTDALGNVTSFSYDADGNLLSQTDANSHTTSYVYNALDQRVETRYHDGSTMLESYDALGRLLSRTDQAGNKTLQRDANGHETRWTYDGLGRVLGRTLPLGQTESFSYDAKGNQLSHTDFNGDTTTYDYDENDRLVTVTYADSSSESYTYDAVGNRLTATDASGTISYAYDSRNRLVLETKPDGTTLAYDYDAAGNRIEVVTTVQTDNGPVTLIDSHSFDELNRLATSTDSGFNTTSYSYDDVGNRAGIAHPNGNVTTYSYDSLNRLTQLSVYDAGNVLVDQFTYTLGATGRREAIAELSGRSSSYVYDDLYRLSSESITDPVNGNHDASYVYDAVGNRTSSTVNGVTTSYSYDANNRLTSAGGDSWSYDANGNTVSQTEGGVTTSYDYDKRNRLVAITTGGVTTSYSYDVNGIRTGRSSGGSSTDFIVDHNRDYAQVVAEVTDGEFARGYSFGDDLISQVFPGGSNYYYHYDGLGSTRSLSDATGLFTDEYDYEAFGELTNSTGGTENSYLYTGEQYDSTLDNYYLRARYYDQGVGRFTQMDSFQGLQNDPVTLHKYLYANLDPVDIIDPSGYFGLSEQAAVTNITNTLNSLKVDAGISALDLTFGAIGNVDAQSNVQTAQKLIAIASLGAGGIAITRIIAKKFSALTKAKKFDKFKTGLFGDLEAVKPRNPNAGRTALTGKASLGAEGLVGLKEGEVYIYAINSSDEMVLAFRKSSGPSGAKHPQLTGGGPAKAAGELVVSNGNILINAESGNFLRQSPDALIRVKALLQSTGHTVTTASGKF